MGQTHTETVQETSQVTDSSWSTTSTSASAGLTHLVQMQRWVAICCIPSSVHSCLAATQKPEQPPSFCTLLCGSFYSLGFGHHSDHLQFIFSEKGLHIDVFLICSWAGGELRVLLHQLSSQCEISWVCRDVLEFRMTLRQWLWELWSSLDPHAFFLFS